MSDARQELNTDQPSLLVSILWWAAALVTAAALAGSFYLWGKRDGLNYVCHLKAPNVTYTCTEEP